MNLDLEGTLAVVTAGAHGIGAAVADELTTEGARVLVADVDAEALAARGAAWHGTMAADLATADGVAGAVAWALEVFGRAPDILVNNLGVGQASSFEETTDESWLRSFEINLLGCVRVCRALVPLMAARGAGAVVNTGSDLAKQPEPCCQVRSGPACGRAPAASSIGWSSSTASIATRPCGNFWRIARCRWALAIRKTSRTRSCSSRRRVRG